MTFISGSLCATPLALPQVVPSGAALARGGVGGWVGVWGEGGDATAAYKQPYGSQPLQRQAGPKSFARCPPPIVASNSIPHDGVTLCREA